MISANLLCLVASIVSAYGQSARANELQPVQEDNEAIKSLILEEVASLPSCNDGVRDFDFPQLNQTISFQSTSETQDDYTRHMIDMAAYFSAQDGVPSTALLAIEAEGNGAKSDSQSWSNSGYILSSEVDCARHFLWNFRSIKNVLATKEETRKFTNNYEWANVLHDEHDTRYQMMYDYYLTRGYTESAASNAADADADDYVYNAREYLYAYCATSRSFFDSIFSDSNIMDFYNNRAGRDATDREFWWDNAAKKRAFSYAKQHNQLILRESDVTESIRDSIYGTGEWDTENWYAE